MADYSWVPKELEGRFSHKKGKLVASCEVCEATKAVSSKASVLRQIEQGKQDRFRFCSLHGDFGHAKPSPEDVASWPENHKRCRRCLEVKHFDEFHNHSGCLLGKAVECKQCRQPSYAETWKKVTFEQSMLRSAKSRAKERGLEFDLELEDIVIPEKCPILNVDITLKRNSRYAPSIDRRNPSLGYTKDNIIIMSRRANLLKNDMSKEEAILLADWMNQNCSDWTIVYA